MQHITTILTSLSSTEDTIFNILPEKTVFESIPVIDIYIYILGFDNFINSKIDKKATFNSYFIIRGKSIPKIIVMYFELVYRTLRNLQNNDYNNEKVKGICNFIGIDESEQCKYACEFDTNEKDLINVKVIGKYEFDGEEININGISLIAESYTTNLQNAESAIFGKTLFLLNNSYTTNNKYDFIITGNLMKNKKIFNYKELQLIISFLSENKNEKEIKNISCTVFELNQSECSLNCKPNESLNGKILKGFSYLNDSNLIINFKENESKVDLSTSSGNRFYNKGKKGLSTGGIVAIILSCACSLFILLFVLIYSLKGIKGRANKTAKNESDSIVKCI